MTSHHFNLRQLDNLSYDDVEPILYDYIQEAIDAFIASDVGKTHVANYPVGGWWIGTFIEMAYMYGERTLPKMTRRDTQQLMEYTLPRKITLREPSDAEEAIPELVAFWTFLKQEYTLRSAGAIANYLLSIEDKFKTWMFDPARGGIAKAFMMQGMEAGHDMGSKEGIAAFQTEYNQQLKATPSRLPPNFPMEAPPPNVQAAFDQLGISLPAPGQPINPADLIKTIIKAANQLKGGSKADMVGDSLDEPLPQEAIEILTQQTISTTAPGTILKDFHTLLEFIGTDGIAVSGKRHTIPMKVLAELNQLLSHPIDIALQRPQQKSYAPIHGLCLLIRASGLGRVVVHGKKHRLVRDPIIHDSWQTLNPTEQYCTLLEAWLIRAHGEMVGEEQSGPFNEGDRCLRLWHRLAEKKQTYKNYSIQHTLNVSPGWHNLALMKLFGLVEIQSGKPSAGKGWRVRSVTATPWGKALMSLVRKAHIAAQFHWPSEADPTVPFNELQPVLQPYFPEWQASLSVPQTEFRPGQHIFKVSLGKIWRRLAISGEATLEVLGELIRASVEFDSDHLDEFVYTNEIGRKVAVLHPSCEDGITFTDEVTVGSLPLTPGSTLQYVFDFGDHWQFNLLLESVDSDHGAKVAIPSSRRSKKSKTATGSRSQSRNPLGEIIESHGQAPTQYGSYSDEWE